ncbi:MAG: DUF819 family protein [Acidobacteriota bacterium]
MGTEAAGLVLGCAAVSAGVLWTARQTWAQRFFRIVPAVLLVYYVPAVLAAVGLLPRESAGHEFMREIVLPFSLFLLLATADPNSILRLGPRALGVMLFGTLGVVLGGPAAYWITRPWLPEEAWRGLAAIAGSWIGGSGNFAAIKEAVATPDDLVGPLIIVDTAVAYTWTGILLFLAPHQALLDRWTRADRRLLDEVTRRLEAAEPARPASVSTPGILGILACGLAGTWISRQLGWVLEAGAEPLLQEHVPALAGVFSSYTWMVLVLTTLGIALSLTRFRRLESYGASQFAYSALYLFLASLGTKADAAGLAAAPGLLAAGVVWMLVHIAVLALGARLLRAPAVLAAVGSQANIGGVATAPIVAAAYCPPLAPLGLLLGIFGYLVGNYGGLLCAALLRFLA